MFEFQMNFLNRKITQNKKKSQNPNNKILFWFFTIKMYVSGAITISKPQGHFFPQNSGPPNISRFPKFCRGFYLFKFQLNKRGQSVQIFIINCISTYFYCILRGYSNLSNTEAPKIPTFQSSKNSYTVLGQAPKCPTTGNAQLFEKISLFE